MVGAFGCRAEPRFLPAEALKPDTKYVATVTSGIMDSSGNRLAENYQWWFRTQSNQQRVYLPLVSRTQSNQ